ncbi:MAG: hypothetical protein PHG36_08870, partial [Dehalococcoidia bacterium]|nr:hypothetical protein [Dehalococcoidia bacterium]
RGTANGSAAIKLYINGEVESVQGVTVAGGKAKSLSFTIARNQPGTYMVYIGGYPAGSFVVEEYVDPDIILFISLGMIFTSFILSIVYIRRRRAEYW